MKRENLFVLLFLLFGLSLVVANQFPNYFVGEINYLGNPSIDLSVYDLSAEYNGVPLGIVGEVGQEGFNKYVATISVFGSSGGEVRFFVGDSPAEPTYTFQPGMTTDANLTISSLPSNAVCNNGIREPPEQCDGDDMGFATCSIIMELETGIEGWNGDLGCTVSCTYDTSECIAPFCGDGNINNDIGEQCDDGNSIDGDGCSSTCIIEGPGGGNSGGGGGGSGGGGSGSGGGSSGNANIPVTSSNANNNNQGIENNSNKNGDFLEEFKVTDEEARNNFFSIITGAVVGNLFGNSGIFISIIFLLIVVTAFFAVRAKRARINSSGGQYEK